jgi:hypothetical protein
MLSAMTMTYTQATEAIYQSLEADNLDIDIHIANLKAAMAKEGVKEFTAEPSKLAQNNRSGRKLMQAYFKKRGVKVTFPA